MRCCNGYLSSCHVLARSGTQSLLSLPIAKSYVCCPTVKKTAAQGQYALNTVRAVYESMPANILHEIIVVDDGSEPPLAESFLTRDVVNVYKVTIIRHVCASN